MMVSLTNLPTKKAGKICIGFILAIPAAVNKGVDDKGVNVYIKTKS